MSVSGARPGLRARVLEGSKAARRRSVDPRDSAFRVGESTPGPRTAPACPRQKAAGPRRKPKQRAAAEVGRSRRAVGRRRRQAQRGGRQAALVRVAGTGSGRSSHSSGSTTRAGPRGTSTGSTPRRTPTRTRGCATSPTTPSHPRSTTATPARRVGAGASRTTTGGAATRTQRAWSRGSARRTPRRASRWRRPSTRCRGRSRTLGPFRGAALAAARLQDARECVKVGRTPRMNFKLVC